MLSRTRFVAETRGRLRAVIACAPIIFVFAFGCSTKKFVRTEVGEVNDKVDAAGRTLEETQERTRRNEGHIAEVDQKAAAAERAAAEAQARAQAAAEAAAAAAAQIRELDNRVNPTIYTLQAELTLDDRNSFQFGRSGLGADAQTRIDELIGSLNTQPGAVFVEVQAHADGTGALNARMALERAEAVKRYLYEQHGIPLHRLNVISYGEDKPVAPNNTREGRAANRRVVVRILAPAAGPAWPRPATVQAPRTDLRWNAWAESALGKKVTFRPAPSLKARGTYRIVLDVSAVAYSKLIAERKTNEATLATQDKAGVASVASSRVLSDTTQEWLHDAEAAEEETVDLSVLLLPHPGYFAKPPDGAEWWQPLQVNLKKVRAALAHPATEPEDPLATLRERSEQPFSFGRVAFTIETVGSEGLAPIAVSIWRNGRPLDDFAVRFCVSEANDPDKCSNRSGQSNVDYALSGVDSLNVGMQQGAVPTAAIHFVELAANAKVRAVFKRNDDPTSGYVSWSLNFNARELSDYLRQTQLNAIARSVDDRELKAHGEGLFNTLFPSDGREGDAAREAFRRFLRAHPAGQPRPSLFVRLIQGGSDPMLLVPLGLARVDGEFLGFRVRIESPLSIQNYRPTAACVSQWTALMPGPKTEQALDDAMAVLRRPESDDWLLSVKPEQSVEGFREWLTSSVPDPTPLALLTVSHHDANALYFQPTGPRVTSANVLRRFETGSIAILNGCGTGSPGAEDIVRTLNRRGVSTVIATSTTVPGTMAGHFLACFSKSVAKGGKTGVKIADAYSETLECLRTKSDLDGGDKYDARALQYSLLGNGDQLVCAPGDSRR